MATATTTLVSALYADDTKWIEATPSYAEILNVVGAGSNNNCPGRLRRKLPVSEPELGTTDKAVNRAFADELCSTGPKSRTPMGSVMPFTPPPTMSECGFSLECLSCALKP